MEDIFKILFLLLKIIFYIVLGVFAIFSIFTTTNFLIINFLHMDIYSAKIISFIITGLIFFIHIIKKNG